jgi:hypothetical protein
VLLPSDTHRKPITFITAALLPFVTYLLTLPRTIERRKDFLFVSSQFNLELMSRARFMNR